MYICTLASYETLIWIVVVASRRTAWERYVHVIVVSVSAREWERDLALIDIITALSQHPARWCAISIPLFHVAALYLVPA